MASSTPTKSAPTTSTLASEVVDDESDLGRRQAPVDVDAHGVAEGGAIDDLEVLDAVLVEEGDTVLGTDTRSAKSAGDAPSTLVQLAPRDGPVAE